MRIYLLWDVANTASKSSQVAEAEKETNELVAMIDELLDNLTVKFASVSTEILGKSMFTSATPQPSFMLTQNSGRHGSSPR